MQERTYGQSDTETATLQAFMERAYRCYSQG